MVVAALAAGAVLLYLALRPGPPRVVRAGPLLVGVDDDTLKWTAYPLTVVRHQRSLGADAVRVWVPWDGTATPGPIRRIELARAEQAARHTQVVLAVFGSASLSPTTPAEQDRFCGYARSTLALVPRARAVVVWNETNTRTSWHGTPADYERLLARCYDVLHAARPGVTVLDSTASAHAPGAFLRAIGRAYRASGRARPLVDAFGHNPYPRTSAETPTAVHTPGFIGEGDYARLTAVLDDAFAGTGQRSRDVWYLEDGYQTATPTRLLGGYSGRETVPTVPPGVQAERLRQAVLLAACQPQVKAFFNFELVDETRLAGWQSGLFWRGAGRKPAAAAFTAAAKAARTGTISCDASTGTPAARP
ncbi:MAG TPA: hypothetical protein VJ986_10070 [Gaiellaceae bacterium]|nr:hypothetical protein [Gaiellaceae bacterium]